MISRLIFALLARPSNGRYSAIVRAKKDLRSKNCRWPVVDGSWQRGSDGRSRLCLLQLDATHDGELCICSKGEPFSFNHRLLHGLVLCSRSVGPFSVTDVLLLGRPHTSPFRVDLPIASSRLTSASFLNRSLNDRRIRWSFDTL